MLGTSAGRDELEGLELGNAQFSSAVRAVVDLYGPVYVGGNDPPFLIMQGKQDCLTPWQQAQELYDALHGAGVPAHLVYLPTAAHADDQFNSPENQATVDDLLDRNLMGARRRAATPAPAALPSSSRSAEPPSR